MQDVPAVLGLFGSSFGIAFSGALMPGPVLTLTISESLGKGTRAGPLIMIGHAIVEIALITAAALGLRTFLKQDAVQGVIGLVGGAVLLWMAVSMARSSRHAAEEAVSAIAGAEGRRTDCARQNSALRCIALGAATSVSNPYWTFWWVTIGLGLLATGMRYGPFGVASFYTGHILADVVWYTLVAFVVARGAHWLSARGYRVVLLVCAAVLLGLGLWFGTHGVNLLGRA